MLYANQKILPSQVYHITSLHLLVLLCMRVSSGGAGVLDPSLENHKYIGVFLFSITGMDPLENHQGFQASIHCLTIIGPLAKRHLYGVSLVGDDGPLLVLYASSVLSSSTKKVKKKTLSELDPEKPFWIRACCASNALPLIEFSQIHSLVAWYSNPILC